MKNIIIVVLAILLVIAIAFIGVGFYKGWDFTPKDNENIPVGTDNGNEIPQKSEVVMENVVSNGIRLASAEVATQSGALSTYSFFATVLPENAHNKDVEWELGWKEINDSTSSKNVLEYVTVTPMESNPRGAEVSIVKEFPHTPIILKVITVDGHKEATCELVFMGYPTGIKVEAPAGVTKENLRENGATSGRSVSCYVLNAYAEYEFDLQYVTPYSVTAVDTALIGIDHTTGSGSYIVHDKIRNRSTGEVSIVSGSEMTYTYNTQKDFFFTISCANGKLTIKTLKAMDSFTTSTSTVGSNVRSHGVFKESFVSGDEIACHFTVYLQATVNGGTMSNYFSFVIRTGVSSVSLNNSTLTI